jgi:putative heme iron utilization protein
LLVTQGSVAESSLRSPRLTLLGHVARVIDDGSVREDYLERHPDTREWLSFGDFGFYRMEVVEAYYVAGFGDMGWVAADDYRKAKPDPLADHVTAILAHMNADHADALVLYCRAYAGIEPESATMEDVDQLGFRVRARLAEEWQDLRINFPRRARTPKQARTVLVEMVRDARATLDT